MHVDASKYNARQMWLTSTGKSLQKLGTTGKNSTNMALARYWRNPMRLLNKVGASTKPVPKPNNNNGRNNNGGGGRGVAVPGSSGGGSDSGREKLQSDRTQD